MLKNMPLHLDMNSVASLTINTGSPGSDAEYQAPFLQQQYTFMHDFQPVAECIIGFCLRESIGAKFTKEAQDNRRARQDLHHHGLPDNRQLPQDRTLQIIRHGRVRIAVQDGQG